jgi:hypothetical protein
MKFDINGDDFREAYCTISAKVAEPQFEGRPRPNWEIMRMGGTNRIEYLTYYLEEHPKSPHHCR